MATTLSTAIRNNLLLSIIKNSSNYGSFLYNVTGYGLTFYTGSPPASPDSAATGTALNTIQPLGATPWTSPSDGVIALAAPISVTPTQTGTAGYCRLTAYNLTVFDMTVGTAGSGAGIIVSTNSFVTGIPISVTDLSVQMPASLGTVLVGTALRNAILSGMRTNVSMPAIAFAQGGTISVYTGPAPASADTAPTGTLLASWSTTSTSWGAVSGASVPLAANLSVNALATGTAGYARFTNGSYTMQLSVGTTGADLIMDSLSLTSGSPTIITDATVSM